MGSLQDIFTAKRSNDVLCATSSAWQSYDYWARQTDSDAKEKSGPVTTIVIGKSEIDTELNKLGVVQRAGISVADSIRVDHSLSICNIRRGPNVAKTVQMPKQKSVGLQPKDLTANDLQECIDGDIKYQEIMEMYGFTSERYFKEVLKTNGYRLLRNELWVVKDRLWLKNTGKGLIGC